MSIYRGAYSNFLKAHYIKYIIENIIRDCIVERAKILPHISALNFARKKLLNGYFSLQKKSLLPDSEEISLNYPVPLTLDVNSREQYKASTGQQSTFQEQLDRLLKTAQQQLQKIKTDAMKSPYFSTTPGHNLPDNFNTLSLEELLKFEVPDKYPYHILDVYLKDTMPPSGGAHLIEQLMNLNP